MLVDVQKHTGKTCASQTFGLGWCQQSPVREHSCMNALAADVLHDLRQLRMKRWLSPGQGYRRKVPARCNKVDLVTDLLKRLLVRPFVFVTSSAMYVTALVYLDYAMRDIATSPRDSHWKIRRHQKLSHLSALPESKQGDAGSLRKAHICAHGQFDP